MSSPATSSLVDDSDYHVQYQSGWIWQQGVAELDATRHGANIAGLVAWLSFTGTGVRVVGTLGASDKNGQPKTTYLIDGNVAGTYSAPLTPSGETQYNVTFFSARDLSPGDHIVTINNTDGTAPNTFWLDYFLIDTVPGASSGGVSSPSPTFVANPVSSGSPTGASSGVVSTVDGTVPTGAAQTSPVDPSNHSTSSSTSHTNVGAIAGGTVGGVAILAILALAFLCLRRRRRRDATEAGPIAPFTYAQDRFMPGAPGSHQPSIRYSATPSATLPSAPPSNFGHRPPTAPPSEVAPESVVSQSESYAPSATSGSALLAPVRRVASPPAPSAPVIHRPPPISEKSHRSPVPTTPSLGYTTTPTTLDAQPESVYSSSAPQTPASPAFSAASGAARLVPPAALPPGEWHAPPDAHGRAHALLRALFSRGSRGVPGASASAAGTARDVDSGLRLYDEVVLPPPYTQE